MATAAAVAVTRPNQTQIRGLTVSGAQKNSEKPCLWLLKKLLSSVNALLICLMLSMCAWQFSEWAWRIMGMGWVIRDV